MHLMFVLTSVRGYLSSCKQLIDYPAGPVAYQFDAKVTKVVVGEVFAN